MVGVTAGWCHAKTEPNEAPRFMHFSREKPWSQAAQWKEPRSLGTQIHPSAASGEEGCWLGFMALGTPGRTVFLVVKPLCLLPGRRAPRWS